MRCVSPRISAPPRSKRGDATVVSNKIRFVRGILVTHRSVIKTTLVGFCLPGLVDYAMKRDGRSFDHRTLEVIRLMAVERVRAGERPTTVIASYGFSRIRASG